MPQQSNDNRCQQSEIKSKVKLLTNKQISRYTNKLKNLKKSTIGT